MWDEPPFYRVFDAVLDNEGDAVFLLNGGDGELIRYDIGGGRTSRIGRRGSGPGEFGRPVWLEPHGPDSLLAYDMSLGRFSVLSRSGDFGRIFKLPGDGGRGRHVAAVTRMGARVWAALSLGTPPGTKARDTVAFLEVTAEGGAACAGCSRAGRDRCGSWKTRTNPRCFTASGPPSARFTSVAYHAPRHEYDRNDARQGGYDGGDSRNASVDAVARDALQCARAGGIFVVFPVPSVVNATVRSARFSKPRRNRAGRGTRWIGDLPSGDLPLRSIPRGGCSLHRFHHFGVLPQISTSSLTATFCSSSDTSIPLCLSRPANLTERT